MEAPTRSDAELLAEVAERDRGALRELYLRHEPWLVPRLTRRCSDPAAVVGALAATVALGLDDPAYALLDPVPVGARHRIGLRVVLVLPLAVGGMVAFAALAGDAPTDTGVAELLALAMTAIAVVAIARPLRPDAAPTLGAAVALGWSLGAALVPDGVLGDVFTLWFRHPWLVVAVATIGFALAPRR